MLILSCHQRFTLNCYFVCVCLSVARGVDMEAANAKFKPTKAKALKVLDGKSAQNICKSIQLPQKLDV